MTLLNTYKTNLCKNALEHWEVFHAVREFIQNALDSHEPSYDLSEEDSLVISNRNIKVDPKALMMGKSDKREDKDSVGKFGTGLNFAISVLLDAAVSITIENSDVIWIPKFSYCETFKDDILVIEEFVNPKPHHDYIVTIKGLQKVDIENIKETTLIFQERAILAETKYGNIVENPKDSNGGEMFVRGLFVTQNKNFKYSYDFLPEYLPLNQDRNIADQWELQQICAKMWSEVEDVDLLKSAIQSESFDCRFIASSWNVKHSHSATEVIAEEFFKEKGACLITEDFDEYLDLQKAGNKVEYISDKALYHTISQSDEYDAILDDTEVIERENPNEIVETVLTLLWQQDIIPVDSINEQNEGVGTDIKLLLYKLRDEGIAWRN